jgi:hypothetical protein
MLLKEGAKYCTEEELVMLDEEGVGQLLLTCAMNLRMIARLRLRGMGE